MSLPRESARAAWAAVQRKERERGEIAQAGTSFSGTSELGPLHLNMNTEQTSEVGKDKTEAGSRDQQGKEQRARQAAQGEATALAVRKGKRAQQYTAAATQPTHPSTCTPYRRGR